MKTEIRDWLKVTWEFCASVGTRDGTSHFPAGYYGHYSFFFKKMSLTSISSSKDFQKFQSTQLLRSACGQILHKVLPLPRTQWAASCFHIIPFHYTCLIWPLAKGSRNLSQCPVLLLSGKEIEWKWLCPQIQMCFEKRKSSDPVGNHMIFTTFSAKAHKSIPGSLTMAFSLFFSICPRLLVVPSWQCFPFSHLLIDKEAGEFCPEWTLGDLSVRNHK